MTSTETMARYAFEAAPSFVSESFYGENGAPTRPQTSCLNSGSFSHKSMEGVLLLYVSSGTPSRAIFGQGNGQTGANPLEAILLSCVRASRHFSDQIAHAAAPDARMHVSWLDLALAADTEMSIEAVGVLIDEISQDLHQRLFDRVDYALRTADVQLMCEDAAVAIARTTYPAKSMLPNWQYFVQRARNSMECRGKNEPFLAGL